MESERDEETGEGEEIADFASQDLPIIPILFYLMSRSIYKEHLDEVRL